jgi:hypothetical protein
LIYYEKKNMNKRAMKSSKSPATSLHVMFGELPEGLADGSTVRLARKERVGSTGSRGGGRKVVLVVRKERVGSTGRLSGGRKVVFSTQWRGTGIWLSVRNPTGSTSTFMTKKDNKKRLKFSLIFRNQRKINNHILHLL